MGRSLQVVKILSNKNYVLQKTGTRYIQTLQRIRLRLYAPNQRIPDITVKTDCQLPDPEVKTTHDDWYSQAWETEFREVLFGNSSEQGKEEAAITEVPIDEAQTTQNEAVITTASESSTADRSSQGDITSYNLDVSDNPYITTPPPIETP